MRLDKFLFSNNYIDSRTKAIQLIKDQKVLVNHQVATSAHQEVSDQDEIELLGHCEYVSRGSEKLLHLIQTYHLDFQDSVVLDIGASTGGFSQVCLNYGARKVYSLDVGTNQLHPILKNDPRIVDMSQTHLDKIPFLKFDPAFNIVVTDVSFISLTRVFDAIDQWKGKLKYFCCLIKPQFECGYDAAKAKQGLIVSDKMHQLAIQKIVNYAKSRGWTLLHDIIESPIKGSKKGNTEFLGVFR